MTVANEAYYLEQAALCAAEAEAATLANARDRALRAQQNWLRLAGRAGRVEKRREGLPQLART